MLSSARHIFDAKELFFRALPDIFQGIDKIVCFSKKDDGQVEGYEMTLTNNHYHINEMIIDSPDVIFAFSGKETTGYSWLLKEQLPFEEKRELKGQLSLFDEQQHFVLQLKIVVPMDAGDRSDLFYIYLREDESNFGISRIQGVLDTTRKALLGSMISRFISVFYDSINKLSLEISRFTNVTKQILEQNATVTNSLSLKNWIREWADNYLLSLTGTSGILLSLSEQALDKLAMHDFNSSCEALKNAASFAMMLHSEEHEIEIKDSYLVFKSSETANSHNSSQSRNIPNGKIAKTMQLLDNLEQAASHLLSTGEDLTGSAVGQLMDKPITAPAITDYLKKNKPRIMMLLNKYPDKWSIIRKQFRPLINIIEKSRNLSNTG